MEGKYKTLDVEKLGFTAEQLEAIDSEIAGLKAKNFELIANGKENEELRSKLQELEIKHQTSEEEAAIALAEKDGDISKYKKAIEDYEAKKLALQQEHQEAQRKAQEAKDQLTLEGALNEFRGYLVNNPNDPAGRPYMENKFIDAVEVVEGAVKPKDITLDLDSLKKSLLSDEAHAKYVAANVGSGTGSAGSSGSGSASAKKPKDMTPRERAEFKDRDPDGFKLAFNLQR